MEELVWEAKGLRAEAPSPCVFSKMKRTNPGNSESGELGGMGIGFGPWSSKKWGGFFFLNLEMGRILSPSFQRFCGTVQVGLVSTGYARQTMVGKKSQMVLHRTTVHGHNLDVHKKNPIISSL